MRKLTKIFNLWVIIISISTIVQLKAQNNMEPNTDFQKSTNQYITLQGACNNYFYQVSNEPQNQYLYIETLAGKYETTKERTPLNLSLVIDRSGSMSGEKIAYVRKAAEFIIDNLNPDDYLSIVIYDDQVEVLQKSQKLENKEHLKNLVKKITDRGSTNLSGGMLEGYQQVKSTYKNGYINRVLLLTDGLANVGITQPEKLYQIAKNNNLEHGISLSTFGVGADFNELLMTNLAEYGMGNYYFIESPDLIPSIFDKELKGLLAVIAQNAKLQITIPEGISIDKVFGFKYEIKDKLLVFNFRDIFSQETKGILIRYQIPANLEKNLLFKTELTYDDAIDINFARKTLHLAITQEPKNQNIDISKHQNMKVKEQVALFESNERLEKAMFEVDNGNYDKAKLLLNENETYLDSMYAEMPNSDELKKQKETNTKYEGQIDTIEEMDVQEIKIMQKSTRSINYDIRKKK